jgi:hypothetical protein
MLLQGGTLHMKYIGYAANSSKQQQKSRHCSKTYVQYPAECYPYDVCNMLTLMMFVTCLVLLTGQLNIQKFILIILKHLVSCG